MTAKYASYHDARCCALTAYGKRCGRRWASARPVTWAWDPETGKGIDGPYVVLCGVHRAVYERRQQAADAGSYPVERLRVFGGWYGPYNLHNFGGAVWSHRLGWKPAAAWWKHRREIRFGEQSRKDAM